MPVLNNARHERFAQERVQGMAAGRAYEAAGYDARGDAADANAARLLKSAAVAGRVQELQEAAAAHAEVTMESVAAELEEARALARQERNPAAMVAATMGKAKLFGLMPGKPEAAARVVYAISSEPLSMEEWEARYCIDGNGADEPRGPI